MKMKNSTVPDFPLILLFLLILYAGFCFFKFLYAGLKHVYQMRMIKKDKNNGNGRKR